ncbi:AAA ATPase cdc48 [Marasmius crinis-equi]|uniref:AAA ATPase cdc48 n=1 Tax=Marasmius crinis-equi TaxID=585013 RepID=A0ABR3F835_9AGAR
MKLSNDINLKQVAADTHSHVSSNLASLRSEATMQQTREKMDLNDLDEDAIDAEVLDSLGATMENLRLSLGVPNCSALRETAVEVQTMTWVDIGGLGKVKLGSRVTVQYLVNRPEKLLEYGMSPSKGVLFYGPPGTGTTFLAKAIAHEYRANTISMKVCFFFSSDDAGGAGDRVFSQILTEMEGTNAKKNVFVIGATNRPDQIDPALLRSARLDESICIPLTDEVLRLSIFKAALKKSPFAKDVSLEFLAKNMHEFSGTDLAIKEKEREGDDSKMEEDENEDDPVPEITKEHFEEAIKFCSLFGMFPRNLQQSHGFGNSFEFLGGDHAVAAGGAGVASSTMDDAGDDDLFGIKLPALSTEVSSTPGICGISLGFSCLTITAYHESKMSQPDTFGDTISNGIQDISALLPLLGTEQCERHVGAALEKGYLYAAATPLSIFGSLGIVKTAFATFLGTMTSPFNGGSWLDDAGFGTTGSVASMITIVPNTKRYGAEVRLEQLMKEQHIDDPELVSDIEFGSQRDNKLGSISWNWSLVVTSTLASVLSISPYIYLAHNIRGTPLLSWLFPSLRAFGSLLCVVSVQLALQCRIHHIVRGSLLLSKVRKQNPLSIQEAMEETNEHLEARLRKLLAKPEKRQHLRIFRGDGLKSANDPEKGQAAPYRHDVAAQLTLDIRLLLFQVLLILGMAMIVVGYVGCFNLVSQTDAKSGPYVWLATETFLCLLRIVLWGSNPSWDERNTGMTMCFALHKKTLSSSDISLGLPAAFPAEHTTVPLPSATNLDLAPDPSLFTSPANHATPPHGTLSSDPPPSTLKDLVTAPSSISNFPLITTPHCLSDLATNSRIPWVADKSLAADKSSRRDSFVAREVEDFLAAATSYIGPLPRVQLDGDVSIFFALVPEIQGEHSHKFICATARPPGTWGAVSIFISDTDHVVFSSCTRGLDDSRALQVFLEDVIDPSAVNILDKRTIGLIVEYSDYLYRRLSAQDSYSTLQLSWTCTAPFTSPSPSTRTFLHLTQFDKEYMRLGRLCDLKGDMCMADETAVVAEVFESHESQLALERNVKYGLLFRSAVLEVYLCLMERRFIKSIGTSAAISHHLMLGWIHNMDRRLSMEAEASRRRTRRRASTSEPSFFNQISDSVAHELRSLRRLPIDSPALLRWEGYIATIISDESPQLSQLLETQPFIGTPRFAYFFRIHARSSGLQFYHGLINIVRSSIQRLHSIRPPPFGHIDPMGPGSPEFSPPCTSVHSYSDHTLEALVEQIDSVHILTLETHDSGGANKVFEVLNSLTVSPLILTTLAFKGLSFDERLCSALSSVLRRHTQITYLVFDRCSFSGPPEALNKSDRDLHSALIHNQRLWRLNAWSLRAFHYQVGVDCDKTLSDGNEYHIVKRSHNLCFSDKIEIRAFIYIPHCGRIVPVLSSRSSGMSLTIDLLAFRRVGVSDRLRGTHTTQTYISGSRNSQTTKLDGLPEVGEGCYEIRIRSVLDRDAIVTTSYYTFEKLTIEFTPTSPSTKGLEYRTADEMALLGSEWEITEDSANITAPSPTRPVLDPESEVHTQFFVSHKNESSPSQMSPDAAQGLPTERLQSTSLPGTVEPDFAERLTFFPTYQAHDYQDARSIDSAIG